MIRNQVKTSILRYSTSNPPPKSLLLKQAKRQGHDKPIPNPSSAIISSLRDVMELFHQNSFTQDDEELESAKKQEKISERFKSGEFEKLIETKFSTNRFSCDTKLLLNNFDKLNHHDIDLVNFAIEETRNNPWDDISLPIQQIWYFYSFGSWGVRNGISFNKPEDVIWKFPSNSKNRSVRKLRRDELVNTWKCIPSRLSLWNKNISTLDIGTRFVIYSTFAVSLIVAWNTYKDRESQDENDILVTVANFVEVPLSESTTSK